MSHSPLLPVDNDQRPVVPVPVNGKDPNVFLPELSHLPTYSPQGSVAPYLVPGMDQGGEDGWVAATASGPKMCHDRLSTKIDTIIAKPLGSLTQTV